MTSRQDKPVKKRAGKVVHSAVSMHASEKAKDIRSRYGTDIDYETLLDILNDRKSTRYPVQLRFSTDNIEPGMFALTEALSENPDDGYVITLHSALEERRDILPALILYQLVLVNYGDLATANDAELFGSTVLDVGREHYYEQIVSLTDSLWES
jgi:hypothetical protein